MAHVTLWSSNPLVERAVRRSLDALPGLELATCRDEADLRARLAEGAELALVDVGAQALEGLRRLEPLVHGHPRARFVVVCDRIENGVVLEAMHIGARSCLTPETLDSDLPVLLHRLLGAARSGGIVCTILSAKGGAGATTVALNVAEELRSSADEEALLVDLDLAYGGLSNALAKRGSFSVSDVLNRGRIDAELVRSTALEVGDGLHLMLSPAAVSLTDSARPDFGEMRSMLDCCRESFAVTVVDAPRVPMDVAAGLVRASDMTLLVFQMYVVDLRSARAMQRALKDLGVNGSSVLPVASRVRRRGMVLSLEDVEEALGGPPLPVANDHEGVRRSMDLGRPMRRVVPRSPARRDIRTIVERCRSAPGGQAPGGTR